MKICPPEAAGIDSDRLLRISQVMQQYVDRGLLAGIVTLVARRGCIVHLERFGLCDVEVRKPMEIDTIFRIYSMTKPITSVALMMLYEEGRFHLTDPVSRFIPAFGKLKVWAGEGKLAELEREVTFRDLLVHTAGLSYGDYVATGLPVDKLYDEADLWLPDVTNQELVRRIVEIPLAYQPGAVWHYSVATDVVGHLVELISDLSLAEFFEKRIFSPLGMEDTAFTVPPEKRKRFAALYGLTPNGPLERMNDPWGVNFFATRQYSGGGGLVSTAADYLRFAQMVLNKGELEGVRLLGRKTVELMTLNHLPPALLPIVTSEPKAGIGFGLGFSVVVNAVETGFMCSDGNHGWSGAAGTHFWIDPQEQLIGILLLQYFPYGAYPVTEDFKTAVYQSLDD